MKAKNYKYPLAERLLKFSADVIIYLRTVKHSSETMDIKRQLIKAATSGGANYEESQGAITKPDIKTKIAISHKEIREANYLRRLFSMLDFGNKEQCSHLVQESSELKKILGTILNKLSLFLLGLGIWNLGLGIWNLEL